MRRVTSMLLLIAFISGVSCKENESNHVTETEIWDQVERDSSYILDIDKNYKKGLEFYSKNEVDSTIFYLDKAKELKQLNDIESKYKYAEIIYILSSLYRDKEENQNGIKVLNEFLKNSNSKDGYPTDAIVTFYSTLSDHYIRLGEIENAIYKGIIPGNDLIRRELQKVQAKDSTNMWKLQFLINRADYLEALEIKNDPIKQKQILNEIEKELFVFESDNEELIGRIFMVYNTVIEHLLRTGELQKAKLYIDKHKALNYYKPTIEEMLIEDKMLSLGQELRDEYLINESRNRIIKLYNSVEDKKYYHEHYYIKTLNSILLDNSFIEGASYETVDSLSRLIEKRFETQEMNVYTNPLHAYNGKFNYFVFNKKLDSAFVYMNKHDSLTSQLNHSYEKLRAFQNQATYFEAEKNEASLLKSLKKYLNDFDIEDYQLLVKEDLPSLDMENILTNGWYASKLNDLYEYNNSTKALKASHNLWLSNLKIFKNLNPEGDFNNKQEELMIKARNNALNTALKLQKHNELENKDLFIEIIENIYNGELLNEANLKVNTLNNKDLKKQDSLRKIYQSKLKYFRKNIKSMNGDSILKYEQKLSKVHLKIKELKPNFFSYHHYRFNYEKLSEYQIFRFYESDSSVVLFEINDGKIELINSFSNEKVDSILHQAEKKIINKNNISLSQNIKTFEKPIKIVSNSSLSKIPISLLIDNNSKVYSYSNSLALIEGNDVVSKTRQLSFSPFYSDSNNKLVNSIERSGSYELPFANEEATYISKLLGGSLFQAEEATKGNYIKNAPNYNIHHLAMHAVVDEGNDYNAQLLFQGDQEEDYLDLEEIYNLNLDADLVTLSACNTAYGKIDPIEGAMSLSRAFQYAGARATVTSLWRVPDRETSVIMKSFYTHLKDGKRKDIALKMAKDDYLKAQVEEKFKHPYYWAGFILTGDPSPIIVPTPWWHYGLYIAGGLLLLMVIRISLSRKRNKT